MKENPDVEMKKEDREQLVELGSDITKSSRGNIYTLTIIGQVEGHRSFLKQQKQPSMNMYCLCLPELRKATRLTVCCCC